MKNRFQKLGAIFLERCSGYRGNGKEKNLATITAVFILVVIYSMLSACSLAVKSSGIITSREATDIWHSYEILPNYKYYYAGPDTRPFYVIGIDERYKLKSRLWKPFDPTPEMLKDWFNYYRPRVGGYNPLPYGAFINGPNNERIGLWYSVLDWRLTGSATLGDNNEVTIFMPADEGNWKRDRDPLHNEYGASDENGDDHRYFWFSRY